MLPEDIATATTNGADAPAEAQKLFRLIQLVVANSSVNGRAGLARI